MAIPIWAGRYIGLPFRDHGRDRNGLDCWGLARLVLAEQFGLALPSFVTDYRRTTDMAGISKVITRETKKWTPVAAGREKTGDIIILRLRKRFTR
jgi:cell wall-associated NlpC family hydrolase